ncbi:MAG: hypothetical protein QOG98_235, partial [Pseudonocardiales bacterium]|nr:hypothetical protein [Pseudonocardiales bacterium]
IDTPDLQAMFVDMPLHEDTLAAPDLGAGYPIVIALMRPGGASLMKGRKYVRRR